MNTVVRRNPRWSCTVPSACCAAVRIGLYPELPDSSLSVIERSWMAPETGLRSTSE